MAIGLTNEEFITACIERHEGYYTYPNTIYTGYYGKVKIECPIHGEFEQRAGDHKRGNGCSKCGSGIISTKQFIELAKIVHSGDLYDYSLVPETDHLDSHEDIYLRCKKHDWIFPQQPRCHIGMKHGCHKCAIERRAEAITLSKEEFIEKARKVHKDLYGYDDMVYIGMLDEISILCKVYNEHFPQKASNHLLGHGCPKCSHRISKPEIAWLNSLNIQGLETQKRLNVGAKEVKVDGFDPNTNTVYEFYGDFWHGNPDVYDMRKTNKANKIPYRVLYEETMEREEHLKSLGYNVISMWENDWKKMRKVK